MLPAFTRDGVLPPGNYELTLDELRSSLLVRGPSSGRPGWDAAWRATLVDNLEVLVRQLWSIGITEVFIDGSFVEDVDHPNDIDGYFVCDLRDHVSGALERRLNRLDPHRAWGWETHLRHPGRHLPLWLRYRVVLWPYSPGTMFGRDERGRLLELSEAFRRKKYTRVRKGIVKLKPPERSS